jgi:hypothetical protein
MRAISEKAINELFFSSGSEVVWKKCLPESYEVAPSAGMLETKEGPQAYLKGYYIMTGPSGERYSMPPEKFTELKEDQGSGVAIPKKIMKLAKLADSDGVVKTSWGEPLHYNAGKDYIIRHASGDYGVVKTEIFEKTYEKQPKPLRPPATSSEPKISRSLPVK